MTATIPPAPTTPTAPAGVRRRIRQFAVGATVLLTLASLSSDDGLVLCPFRRCTGGYCPGCGMTRSAGELARGDVAGSWVRHPFLLIALAQVAVAAVAWAARPSAFRALVRRHSALILLVNTAVLTGIWIVPLIDGSIPAPFG